MGDPNKTVADLTEETAEEIVDELKRRAAPRTLDDGDDKTTETDEDTSTTTEPEDEPEKADESEDTSEGGADAGTDETDEGGDDPLLSDLAEMGIGPYKSRDDLKAGLKELRVKLSRRDEDAQLGRYLMDLGVEPGDLEELVKRKSTGTKSTKPSKTGWAPPHEWDPAWDTQVTQTTTEDGEIDYKGPPDVVQKIKENERYAQTQFRNFLRNPVSTMVEWGLGDQVRQLVREERQRAKGEETYESFMNEHGEFIDSHRDEISALLDEGFSPVAAVKHLKTAAELEELRASKSTDDAKKRDIEKHATRHKKRAGAQKTPIRKVRDLATLPTREALEVLMSEEGLDIPEQF